MRAIDVPAHQAADLAALADLLEDMRSGWRARGACKRPDVDPAWFSPNAGSVPLAARRTCADCPVVADCARFGADQAANVWAGEYPNQLAEWRDSGAPEWADLMAGRTRMTRRTKAKGRNAA